MFIKAYGYLFHTYVSACRCILIVACSCQLLQTNVLWLYVCCLHIDYLNCMFVNYLVSTYIDCYHVYFIRCDPRTHPIQPSPPINQTRSWSI